MISISFEIARCAQTVQAGHEPASAYSVKDVGRTVTPSRERGSSKRLLGMIAGEGQPLAKEMNGGPCC